MVRLQTERISRECVVLSRNSDHVALISEEGLSGVIPTSIIRDNHIDLSGNTLTLSEGLFNRWILEPAITASEELLENWYVSNAESLFTKRQLLTGKELIYCLRPRELRSGGAYIGGFTYSLGELFESMESGNHYFLDEFQGHKSLFLVSISGSPLSGTCNAVFWSDHSRSFVRYSSGSALPGGFMAGLSRMNKVRTRKVERYLLSYNDLREIVIWLSDEY